MFLSKASILTLTTLLLPSVLAQVPAKLSGGFSTEVQVNFQGDSSDGFQDGDTIPFADTANTPVFALGDSSGVNTAVTYMIVMIDSTDENNFIMHYLQTDFKATGQKTGLEASGEPRVPYAQPGAFGEQGARQYTFLLYRQKTASGVGSEVQTVPAAGEKFDYEAFGAANGLEPPRAGVAMKVDVGAGGEPGAVAPPPAPAPAPAPTNNNAGSSSEGGTPAAGDGNETSESPADMITEMIEGGDMPGAKLMGGGWVMEKPYPNAGQEIMSGSTR